MAQVGRWGSREVRRAGLCRQRKGAEASSVGIWPGCARGVPARLPATGGASLCGCTPSPPPFPAMHPRQSAGTTFCWAPLRCLVGARRATATAKMRGPAGSRRKAKSLRTGSTESRVPTCRVSAWMGSHRKLQRETWRGEQAGALVAAGRRGALPAMPSAHSDPTRTTTIHPPTPRSLALHLHH